MIDCSKTENYMHKKARMTKSVVNGVCHIRCTDCPLRTVKSDGILGKAKSVKT